MNRPGRPHTPCALGLDSYISVNMTMCGTGAHGSPGQAETCQGRGLRSYLLRVFKELKGLFLSSAPHPLGCWIHPRRAGAGSTARRDRFPELMVIHAGSKVKTLIPQWDRGPRGHSCQRRLSLGSSIAVSLSWCRPSRAHVRFLLTHRCRGGLTHATPPHPNTRKTGARWGPGSGAGA
jgi:hypothetical protein